MTVNSLYLRWNTGTWRSLSCQVLEVHLLPKLSISSSRSSTGSTQSAIELEPPLSSWGRLEARSYRASLWENLRAVMETGGHFIGTISFCPLKPDTWQIRWPPSGQHYKAAPLLNASASTWLWLGNGLSLVLSSLLLRWVTAKGITQTPRMLSLLDLPSLLCSYVHQSSLQPPPHYQTLGVAVSPTLAAPEFHGLPWSYNSLFIFMLPLLTCPCLCCKDKLN